MAKLEPVETDDSVPQDTHPPPTAAPPQHEPPYPPPMVAPPQHQPPHPPAVVAPPHHQPPHPAPMVAPPLHQLPHPAPMLAPPQYEPFYPPVMTAAPPYQAQPEIQSADYSATVPAASETLVIGKPWSTGLFDCHNDPRSAIKTAYLPCLTFGQIAEVLDAGEMNSALGGYIYLVMMPALCSHWLMGSKYRGKLRRKYDLVEAPHSDIITHIICPCCALAQEFRELKNHGLDPSLGWKGIQAQEQGTHNNGSVEVNVPMNQAMNRHQ